MQHNMFVANTLCSATPSAPFSIRKCCRIRTHGKKPAWSAARERKACDRPISHFQNTRFKLAEMRTQIDVAQVFVECCVMDHNQKQLTPEVAAEAKLFTTELLGKVVDEGVQLHGGWGYMWEYPICKMYANARIQRIFAGTSEIMKEIISRGMKL
jgi:acyl-CoA dehydrogenase